jgi:putative Mg2+ transporter-C (MgtC) family protein
LITITQPNPDEALQPHQLHLICSKKIEQHVRTQIVAHGGVHDTILRGISTEPAGGNVALTAYLLIDGDAPARLERLVAQLTQQPGVQTVRWQASKHHDSDVGSQTSA